MIRKLPPRTPRIHELEALSDEDWADAVRTHYRSTHKLVLDLQWDFILAGHHEGHGCARLCYYEAATYVRRRHKVLAEESGGSVPAADMVRHKARKAGGRANWKGHNACGLIRALAARKWKLDDIKEVLPKVGFVGINPATYKIQYRKGVRGEQVPSLDELPMGHLAKLRNQ